MIIKTTIKCKWCGEEIVIPEKKTTRSYMIAFNKLRKKHDWDCEPAGKLKVRIDEAKKVASDAISKMMEGDI